MLRFLPCQMLLGAHRAWAKDPFQSQPIPRKVPDAQGWVCPGCPWLPCSWLGLWPCPATHPPTPGSHTPLPSQLQGVAPLSLLEGGIISAWKGLKINPGFLENIKPKQTLFVRHLRISLLIFLSARLLHAISSHQLSLLCNRSK